MSRWDWGQVCRMLKTAFQVIVLDIVPQLGVLFVIALVIILIKEWKSKKNQEMTFRRRVCRAENVRFLIYVLYGYLLLHATILRRSPGMYERRIVTDLYFLRAKWYETTETIENILLFLPLGVLLFWSRLSLPRAVLAESGVALALEVIQFVSGCGTCEVADLLLNVVGAVVGYGILAIVSSARRTMGKRFGKDMLEQRVQEQKVSER